MGNSRRLMTLGDLGPIITGKTPSTKVPGHFGGAIPFVTPRDMDGRKTINSTERYLTEKGAMTVASAVIPPGSIMVSCIGSDMGKVAIAGCQCVTNQQINSIIVSEGNIAEYVYYDLRRRKNELRSMASGSAQPILNKGHFSQVHIELPDPDEQRAIACILGALDDKIELNRRMNETLEAMARAIFKSWFVDFDPVRAKAEGRQPPGLAPHIADLFPDAFEESELGEIPKGWRVSKLGDVADVNWGDTNVTKKSYVKDGFIAYSAKGPDGFLPYHDYNRTGVVLSAIGANSGYTWLALGKWSCIKNTIRFWSMDETLSTEYLFHATHGNHHWPLRGSAQPFVSQGDARNVLVLKPSGGLGRLFGEIVRFFHEKGRRSSIENCTLATLRATLLPKLISGELRVPDIERIISRII